MCLNLLRTLAEAAPPFTVRDPIGIDRLRVLQAAGLVEACLPLPADGDGMPGHDAAAVLAITARGWKVVGGHVVDEALPGNWLGHGLKPRRDREQP
ncbi:MULTISPECIES: hypothetical protein [unclassified Variovorax]|uniref:hypothetical protein n=1 Tax=unclassified Variovorax TaxID=663243 RepID=UPI003F4841E0